MVEQENSQATSSELLIRIDERTKNFGKDLTDIKEKMVTRKEFEEFKTNTGERLKKTVTQDEFKPVKTVSYSVVSIVSGSVLLIFIAAIIGALIQ